jgi:hypothetical protein
LYGKIRLGFDINDAQHVQRITLFHGKIKPYMAMRFLCQNIYQALLLSWPEVIGLDHIWNKTTFT